MRNHKLILMCLVFWGLASLSEARSEVSSSAKLTTSTYEVIGRSAATAVPANKGSLPDETRTSAPNVLFIALDDMNDWIQLLDKDAPIRTPNLERLAAKGMLFTQAYCPSPACNPSRAAILTGRMPSTSGVYTNSTGWRKAMPDAVTLSEYYMQNNYRVEGAGKIFHHHKNSAFHDKAAFHDFQFMPWPPDSPMPKTKLNGLEWFGTPNTDWGPWPSDPKNHVDVKTVDYVTRKLAAGYNKPFFLAAGIFRPHMPFFAPGEYFDQYPLESVKMPPKRDEDLDDVPSGGMKMWEETRWFFDGMMKAEKKKLGTWREAVRAYQASATFADAQVGRILDALEASPYMDNTIIVLWSDHGYHLGEKEHWEKFALWEKTTHVPFIVVAPGITRPGSVCDTPVNLIDIYPTLLELCGLPDQQKLDGLSLAPLLKNPEAQWERPSIMTYGPGNHAVRDTRWRYIRYADGSEELYDQKADPHDWHNVADVEKYESIKKRLRAWIPKTDAKPFADLKDRKTRKN